MILIVLFVAGALLLLICAGCSCVEERNRVKKRRTWSSSHDSGWSDTSHVLESAQYKQAVEHYGDAADCWSGNGGGGGDCCGDGGGGDGGGD